MKKLFALLCVFVSAGALCARAADTLVRFHTSLGDIDVRLFPDVAPNTVADFLAYVDEGSYANTFIQHVDKRSVMTGGEFYVDADHNIQPVLARPLLAGEHHLPDLRGTLAMSGSSDGSTSASNLWFFNMSDHTSPSDGRYNATVFGQIINAQELAVADAIMGLDLWNTYGYSPLFLDIPLIKFNIGSTYDIAPYLVYTRITRLPASSFFADETPLTNGVYYLSFPQTGNAFGYYSFLSDANYIYHFDLGYEYMFDAADGKNGVYLYDFKSGHFLYTSPSFPFPYLYDFSLQALLYYYPDPDQTKNPGRYNTNGVRYFYNFSTGRIFVQ